MIRSNQIDVYLFFVHSTIICSLNLFIYSLIEQLIFQSLAHRTVLKHVELSNIADYELQIKSHIYILFWFSSELNVLLIWNSSQFCYRLKSLFPAQRGTWKWHNQSVIKFMSYLVLYNFYWLQTFKIGNTPGYNVVHNICHLIGYLTLQMTTFLTI